jgi:hypothetical protein
MQLEGIIRPEEILTKEMKKMLNSKIDFTFRIILVSLKIALILLVPGGTHRDPRSKLNFKTIFLLPWHKIILNILTTNGINSSATQISASLNHNQRFCIITKINNFNYFTCQESALRGLRN